MSSMRWEGEAANPQHKWSHPHTSTQMKYTGRPCSHPHKWVVHKVYPQSERCRPIKHEQRGNHLFACQLHTRTVITGWSCVFVPCQSQMQASKGGCHPVGRPSLQPTVHSQTEYVAKKHIQGLVPRRSKRASNGLAVWGVGERTEAAQNPQKEWGHFARSQTDCEPMRA